MRLPISIALVAANVWLLLLLNLGAPLAAIGEAILALYVWWAAGGGPPIWTPDISAFHEKAGTRQEC